jgi:FkbM family methyltransferase
MQIRPNDIVIDIGANQGFFTCYAAYHGARVYAFEPFPQSFETLRENVRINGFEKNVAARPWAIGGQNGTANLIYTDREGGVMNSINLAYCQKKNLDTRQQITVPCYTLAQIIEDMKIERIRLCKIDCEGAELDILKQVTEGTSENRLLCNRIPSGIVRIAGVNRADVELGNPSDQLC